MGDLVAPIASSAPLSGSLREGLAGICIAGVVPRAAC